MKCGQHFVFTVKRFSSVKWQISLTVVHLLLLSLSVANPEAIFCVSATVLRIQHTKLHFKTFNTVVARLPFEKIKHHLTYHRLDTGWQRDKTTETDDFLCLLFFQTSCFAKAAGVLYMYVVKIANRTIICYCDPEGVAFQFSTNYAGNL